MVRIVFDPGIPAHSYRKAVEEISRVGPVMGEPVDSYAMKQYGLEPFRARIREYLDILGDEVDVWEIGNEINGEWLGSREEVAAKLSLAFDEVEGRGKTSALTLYYNATCFSQAENEMFRWVDAHLPKRVRDGLDYVWVSYYEDDCQGPRPDWNSVFQELGRRFPNSKLGFGEVGTKHPEKKQELIQRYYRMPIAHPRFVGGYFWWYYRQDMVPKSQPLWRVLDDTIRSAPR